MERETEKLRRSEGGNDDGKLRKVVLKEKLKGESGKDRSNRNLKLILSFVRSAPFCSCIQILICYFVIK